MADTITLLSTSTYSNSATLQSDKAQGDAYFGASDGLHTIAIQLNDFIGTIKIQGSLATDPQETDWFDISLSSGATGVDTTGKIADALVTSLPYTLAETSMKSYNATGNFVWLRVDVSNWTGGTISRIEMNR
tara:strand:- start:422 stop:817 length:396 start_codon:yes stop_codon:yes gene_type:complete